MGWRAGGQRVVVTGNTNIACEFQVRQACISLCVALGKNPGHQTKPGFQFWLCHHEKVLQPFTASFSMTSIFYGAGINTYFSGILTYIKFLEQIQTSPSQESPSLNSTILELNLELSTLSRFWNTLFKLLH
jgi:hypothetical protein